VRQTNSRSTRVLLVTHEASLSGAPRVALLIARTLTEMGHQVHVLSRRPGPLLDDFSRIARTRIEPLYRVRRRIWLTSAIRALALVVDTVLATASLLRYRPDLVYLNSTSAGVYLRPALWLRRRVVLHGHESTEVARLFLTRTRSLGLMSRAELVGCSAAVQHTLAELADRPSSEVAMIPSVPDDRLVQEQALAGNIVDVSPGEIVIGCCGTVERRKGTDLWLEIAGRVREALPDVPLRFLWIGKVVDAGLVPDEERGAFVGPTPNPYPLMSRFDVATLTSRDDPFPLVVLESMMLGVPVVAFDVGEVGYQVGDGGVIVPQEDTAAFADAVIALVTDAGYRADLARRARARATVHFSTKPFADALIELVDRPRGSARRGQQLESE
jgi:glycosyltransferase involved in cell wall biosynthesis